MKNHKILPAGSNSTRLFQMLAQQVGKQPRNPLAGKNIPGGHIVSAALALIAGGVLHDQIHAANRPVGKQDAGQQRHGAAYQKRDSCPIEHANHQIPAEFIGAKGMV